MPTETVDLIVRQASPDDAPIIAEITDAAYEKFVARLGRKPQPMTADYRVMAAEHPIWLLCESVDAKPVGLLILKHEPDAMLIYSIAIRPEYQRKGLGKRLLQLADEKAIEAGYATIRLYTNERMAENVAYYKQVGYHETHQEPYLGTMTVHMAKTLSV